MRSAVLSLFLFGCVDHAAPAVNLYDKGDYAGAARVADEGLASHPKDDGLWGMRVRAALALGDADGVARAWATYDKTRDSLDKELARDLAEATLAQALASPSAKLKIAAIAAVEDAELEDLAEAVFEKMNDDNDRVVAMAAVAVLHAFPQAPHVAADALKSEDPEARRIAVDGIGKKVGKLAVADLEKAGDDSDSRVRRAALHWLGMIKDKDAIELLTKRLRDPDENVRATAAGALARIGVGNLEAYARQALKDKALAVRLAGVDLLVAANRLDELVPLADDADASVALAAAVASKRPDLGEKAVLRAVGDAKWEVRAGAANQLTRAVSKDRALVLARQLAGDADLRVKLAAARVLAHGGDRDGAAAIFAANLAYEPRSGEVHGSTEIGEAVNAAADLAELHDARGATALETMVRDPRLTGDQRAAAARAHQSARVVTAGLVAALADGNAIVRVEAAAVLAMLAR